MLLTDYTTSLIATRILDPFDFLNSSLYLILQKTPPQADANTAQICDGQDVLTVCVTYSMALCLTRAKNSNKSFNC